MEKRPSFDEVFMEVAEAISKRSTCLRRRFGAVLVKNKRILATGYNGSPRGDKHCEELGCLRKELSIPKGERYEVCRAVHAEPNVFLNASRQGTYGIEDSTLFLYGYDKEAEREIQAIPCRLCSPIVRNSGVIRVVNRNPDTGKLTEWDFETTH